MSYPHDRAIIEPQPASHGQRMPRLASRGELTAVPSAPLRMSQNVEAQREIARNVVRALQDCADGVDSGTEAPQTLQPMRHKRRRTVSLRQVRADVYDDDAPPGSFQTYPSPLLDPHDDGALSICNDDGAACADESVTSTALGKHARRVPKAGRTRTAAAGTANKYAESDRAAISESDDAPLRQRGSRTVARLRRTHSESAGLAACRILDYSSGAIAHAQHDNTQTHNNTNENDRPLSVLSTHATAGKRAAPRSKGRVAKRLKAQHVHTQPGDVVLAGGEHDDIAIQPADDGNGITPMDADANADDAGNRWAIEETAIHMVRAAHATELPDADLLLSVDRIYEKWLPPPESERASFTAWANAELGIGIDRPMPPDELHAAAMQLADQVASLARECRLRGLADPQTESGLEIQRRLAITHHRIFNCYYAVHSERSCRADPAAEIYDPVVQRVVPVAAAQRGSAVQDFAAGRSLIDPAVGWAAPVDVLFRHQTALAAAQPGTLSPHQQLLTFLLMRLSDFGWRRLGNNCYQQIFAEYHIDPEPGDDNGDIAASARADDAAVRGTAAQGDSASQTASTPRRGLFATRAWEVAHVNGKPMTIANFVATHVRKEEHREQWLNLTSRSGVRAGIIDHLTNVSEAEFPDIEFDRHVWSFPNGVYDAEKKRFYRRGSVDMARLSSKIASAHYIPHPFAEDDTVDRAHKDWASMPLRNFDKLFADQGVTGEALGWVYALLGRCFYWLREHDNWQVVPFFKGLGKTGKSTLGRMLLSVYPADQTANITCNAQETFGLYEAESRFLWACLELKNNHKVQQSDMQSMISGEQLVVNGKFKDARTVEWRVPGALFGNDPGPWRDAMGSMVRRLVPILFMTRLPQGAVDMRFEDKLKEELPGFILKCNAAYRQHVDLYGDSDVWAVMPEYFCDTQRQLSAELDPVTAFITDPDEWVLDKMRYTRMPDFRKRLARWVRDHVTHQARSAGGGNETSASGVESTLAAFNCTIVSDERWWGNRMSHSRYVVGIGIADDEAPDLCIDPESMHAQDAMTDYEPMSHIDAESEELRFI